MWWTSGAPAPDFPIGSACCWSQRALSVSGVALTGLGSRSRRHVSCARAERRVLGYASRDHLSTSRQDLRESTSCDSTCPILWQRAGPDWGAEHAARRLAVWWRDVVGTRRVGLSRPTRGASTGSSMRPGRE